MVRDRLPTRAFRGGVLTYVFAALAIASIDRRNRLGPGARASIPGSGAAAAGAGTTASSPRASRHDRAPDALALEKRPSDSVQVLVWAAGTAKVGVGDAAPTPLADTLRLSSLSAITADVSEGDVHIRLITPGRMRLGAEVSGGRAIRFTATGRHIVVLKGGVGADTITDP